MPWLNAAIFPDIVIKTDLHSLEDGDMFRDLCAECLRCDIQADTFADILKEVFVDKKLLSLQVPDWFNKVLHGNFEARKQLLLELFLKYNGVDAECSDVEYRTFVGQQLTAWNWSEIEAQCGGNIDVLNELKAEKLLLHIHTLLSPSSAVMAEDVNSMVALENIASTLKVAHNLDIGDINIDNFGFQVFVTQMQKKLKDVKTEWLLNWINALLRTEHVPALLDLAEIMINIDVLRALEHTIFSMLASSVEAEALQSILLVSIKQLGEGCVLKPTMSASELAWRLFKQHNDIHVSDQELKQAFKDTSRNNSCTLAMCCNTWRKSKRAQMYSFRPLWSLKRWALQTLSTTTRCTCTRSSACNLWCTWPRSSCWAARTTRSSWSGSTGCWPTGRALSRSLKWRS